MIVELFGPSGVGKTTLAYALADALRHQGHEVDLVVSSRPAEGTSLQAQRLNYGLKSQVLHQLAPLSRAAKAVSAIPSILPFSRSDGTTESLLSLLPPSSPLWKIRYRRYLSYLGRSWEKARSSDAIIVFDQAYLTAICSLTLLTRSQHIQNTARSLKVSPTPDLVICLDAPGDVLETRLRKRLEKLGAIERLFEFDLPTSLRQIAVSHEVFRMLNASDQSVEHVSSISPQCLGRAVEVILLHNHDKGAPR